MTDDTGVLYTELCQFKILLDLDRVRDIQITEEDIQHGHFDIPIIYLQVCTLLVLQ